MAAAIAVVSALTGCALYDPERGKRPVPADWLEIEENAALRMFVISLTNPSEKTYCIWSSEWPHGFGDVPQSGLLGLEDDGLFVWSEDVDVIEDCFGSCGMLRLRPGQRVMATVRFDKFYGVDFSKPSSTRRLHFELDLWPCSARRQFEFDSPALGPPASGNSP